MSANGKTILLVEDNPDDEALTLRALRKNNILNDVVVAHDGQEALDYFFGSGVSGNPAPAVVLLDLKLPKVDGLEVLQRLGANSYIRKPVDFNQFMDAVRQLGLYWLVLNEAPPRHMEEPR